MQDLTVEDLQKLYPYFSEPRFVIQTVLMNEGSGVLCVILELKMKDLKDLVNTKGWKCVFDEGLKDDESLSICITR